MPSLMSMEDLFYGPPEPTWIRPTREDERLRRYRDRDYSPPRHMLNPEPIPRPVVRLPTDRNFLPVNHELRPIERLARVHTIPDPVPVTEDIRKVVEVPVPSAVPPPTQVVMNTPAAVVAPRVQNVQRNVSPQRRIIHHPIELKVPMCCEKCAKKVKDKLEELQGVESVVTDQYNQKVIVHGRVDPERVLKRVRNVKKRSAFWDMTVDYSDKYRRARQAEAEAISREEAKHAKVVKHAAEAKAMVAPVTAGEVVVNLPQEKHGPKVTAILPAEKDRSIPYVAPLGVHDQQYPSSLRGYKQELYHGPGYHGMERRPRFY